MDPGPGGWPCLGTVGQRPYIPPGGLYAESERPADHPSSPTPCPEEELRLLPDMLIVPRGSSDTLAPRVARSRLAPAGEEEAGTRAGVQTVVPGQHGAGGVGGVSNS